MRGMVRNMNMIIQQLMQMESRDQQSCGEQYREKSCYGRSKSVQIFIWLCLFKTATNIDGIVPFKQIKVVKCKLFTGLNIITVQRTHNTITENQMDYY
jgi:hypothetical protein